MTAFRFHNSKPDDWTTPRPYQDAHLRRLIHGPIQPMEKPRLLERLFGRR